MINPQNKSRAFDQTLRASFLPILKPILSVMREAARRVFVSIHFSINYKMFKLTKLIVLILLLLIRYFVDMETMRALHSLRRPRTTMKMLDEYRKVLPTEIFTRFKTIYMDKSITNAKRLALLDELFTALPHALLKRLPVPAAFRKLPQALQQRVHRIYYSKRMGFDGKMRELERLINRLSTDQQQRLMPIHPVEQGGGCPSSEHMPTLVEFEVPVLLQFSGYLETHLLKAYMNTTTFGLLEWLIAQKGIDEMRRARLVGVLLKQAYQLDPDNFPLPLNGDSNEIDDDIRDLGVRILFGQSPFDRHDLFKAKLEQSKHLFAAAKRDGGEDRSPKNSTINESQFDDSSEATRSWINRLEMFPEAKLLLQEHGQNDDVYDNASTTAHKQMGSMFGTSLDKFFAVFNGTMHWDFDAFDGQNGKSLYKMP